MTTKDTIRNWLKEAKEHTASYMLVVCDTYEMEDYPVFVIKPSDLPEVANSYHGLRMQKVMECYDLSLDWEDQLSEIRAWHGWNPNR